MSEHSLSPNSEDIPPLPIGKSKGWVPSLVWLVPIAAALVGLSLVINSWRTTGPRITISFQTAEGLEVGKTLVKYRNVTIGHVTAITLSANRNSVLVTADLARSASDVATSDAQFWVVRPRIGVGWVSGLDTLLSGAFISAETGESKTRRSEFVGLESPPPLAHGWAGKRVVLRTDDLGSVSLGAPVYFRRLAVGRVIDEKLEPDGSGALLVLFIDAPNDRFINPSSRFWNASGIDVSLSAKGLKLKTESLASVIVGGIAFDTAPDVGNATPTSPGATYVLFKDEATAMAPPDGEPHYVRMRFAQSLRGMSPGAPVEFIGVNIGTVFSVDLDYDARNQSFPALVTAVVYPRRMGRAYDTLVEQGMAESDDKMAQLVGRLVARGLRAQPRPANLLTGQLYLALDFIPGVHTAQFNATSRPLEIPTTEGGIDELQLRLAHVVRKIDELPLQEIARHLDSDLTGMHGTLDRINGELLPGASAAVSAMHDTLGSIDRALAEDSPWRASVELTLGEARRTMRSIRSLANYLDRHPEALIRGRRSQNTGAEAPTEAKEVAP
jgi:paraquat-inducible protein B